jgi:hypothetical protein
MRSNFAQEIENGQKRCSKCELLFAATRINFRASPGARTGLSSKCRNCYAAERVPISNELVQIIEDVQSEARERLHITNFPLDMTDSYNNATVAYIAELQAIYCVDTLGLKGVAELTLPFIRDLGECFAQQYTFTLVDTPERDRVKELYVRGFEKWLRRYIREEWWRKLGIEYRGRQTQQLLNRLVDAAQKKSSENSAESVDSLVSVVI